MDFIETFEKQRNERSRWEYYIHKLPPWDDTTWTEFNEKLDAQSQTIYEEMTDEQLETTVKSSYDILMNFEFSDDKGGE